MERVLDVQADLEKADEEYRDFVAELASDLVQSTATQSNICIARMVHGEIGAEAVRRGGFLRRER
eukprot:3979128-Pyramimonas_sp.AAC.1